MVPDIQDDISQLSHYHQIDFIISISGFLKSLAPGKIGLLKSELSLKNISDRMKTITRKR